VISARIPCVAGNRVEYFVRGGLGEFGRRCGIAVRCASSTWPPTRPQCNDPRQRKRRRVRQRAFIHAIDRRSNQARLLGESSIHTGRETAPRTGLSAATGCVSGRPMPALGVRGNLSGRGPFVDRLTCRSRRFSNGPAGDGDSKCVLSHGRWPNRAARRLHAGYPRTRRRIYCHGHDPRRRMAQSE
jgi:hypothetical protein